MANFLVNISRHCRCNYTSTLRSISTTVRCNEQRNDDVVDLPENSEITIPPYPIKIGESVEAKKARLLYQSRKRGMLENDLLFSTFAGKYLKELSGEMLEQYDRLVTGPSNDWDIYYWATGKKPVPEEYDNELMTLFKKHVQNLNKEVRVRQPNLY